MKTEFDYENLCQNTFKYLNKLKINPLKFLKEIERVVGDVSFQYIPIESNRNKQHYKANSVLIKDDFSENNDETAFSIKDLRLKEIRSKVVDINKTREYNSQVIIHSEKLNAILSELVSGSFKERSSEAIIEYLNNKFENKFVFQEINWIGSKEGLSSASKFVFESLNNIETLLKNTYNFGSVHVFLNKENEYEFSLFLAAKNK